MNPSSPLDDPQQELACQKRADGMTADAAYVAAGYTGRDDGSNNSARFFRQSHVRARIKSIKDRRALMADLDHEFVLRNLKALAKNGVMIGNSNLDDYFAHNTDGQRIGIELADVPRSKMAALEEVTIEQYTEGPRDDPQTIKRTKIKLRAANTAIQAAELIGKHLGMWPNKSAVTITDEFSQMTDEELDAFLARAAKVRKSVECAEGTKDQGSAGAD